LGFGSSPGIRPAGGFSGAAAFELGRGAGRFSTLLSAIEARPVTFLFLMR